MEVDSYDHLPNFDFDHLPNKEEFESFDTDKDGVLFYDEWEKSIDEEWFFKVICDWYIYKDFDWEIEIKTANITARIQKRPIFFILTKV